MKTFQQIAKPRQKPVVAAKPKYNFKKAPTPLPKNYDPYENICRIMPFYVAKNYSFFELLTPPKQKLVDWEGYVLRIKKKISCLKEEMLL